MKERNWENEDLSINMEFECLKNRCCCFNLSRPRYSNFGSGVIHWPLAPKLEKKKFFWIALWGDFIDFLSTGRGFNPFSNDQNLGRAIFLRKLKAPYLAPGYNGRYSKNGVFGRYPSFFPAISPKGFLMQWTANFAFLINIAIKFANIERNIDIRRVKFIFELFMIRKE